LALIEVTGLTFAYTEQLVLEDIRLSIEAGERVAILGARGSGKTTLAHWLAGWLPTAELQAARGGVHCRGRVWDEWPLVERAAFVQFVGQVPAQQFSGRAFTVRDEILFGPENLGLDSREIRERADFALHACHLEHLAARDPFTLSGGEQQRLALATALAMKPEVIVLDEPTTNLDPDGCRDMEDLIQAMPKNVTIILHDASPRMASEIATRFLLLSRGRIQLDGSAEEVLLADETTSLVGLPPVAEAATAARAAGAWKSGIGIPFSRESGVRAFLQVENAPH